MAAPKKNKTTVKKVLFDGAQNALCEMNCLESAIEDEALAFIAKCREERKCGRADARATGEGHATVKTCPFILTYRFHTGSLHLNWSEVIYKKGKKDKPMYRGLPTKNNKTHMAKIIAKAHPAEVAMLLEHEMEARKLRDLWTVYIKARRGINTFCNGLEVAPE